MTQVAPMQNENLQMFPERDVNIADSEIHVGSHGSLEHGASLEDYSRSMLLYTKGQISAFVGDSDRGRGSSGRSSQSSGQSGQSSRSNETTASSGALNANGPPPAAGSKISERDMADDESATY